MNLRLLSNHVKLSETPEHPDSRSCIVGNFSGDAWCFSSSFCRITNFETPLLVYWIKWACCLISKDPAVKHPILLKSILGAILLITSSLVNSYLDVISEIHFNWSCSCTANNVKERYDVFTCSQKRLNWHAAVTCQLNGRKTITE